MVRIAPVVKVEASVARYRAAPTISSGRPPRFKAKVSARFEKTTGSQALLTSVRKVPAMIALQRTIGPKACAKPTVIALSPALAEAYGMMSARGRTAPVLLMLMIDPPPAAAMRLPTSAVRRNG